jgi:hypothetical protein
MYSSILGSDVIQIIRKLRACIFAGSWFDSLETIIVDNVQNDQSYMTKIEVLERKLKRGYNYACHRLQVYRTDLHNTNLNLTSEQTDMMNDLISLSSCRWKNLNLSLQISRNSWNSFMMLESVWISFILLSARILFFYFYYHPKTHAFCFSYAITGLDIVFKVYDTVFCYC